MLGLTKPSVSLSDLQDLFQRVSSAKVFAENVQAFLATVVDSDKPIEGHLEAIERELGLTKAIPFRSLNGLEDPSSFNGVAIWPTGTTNWTELRLEQIRTAQAAGAQFSSIVCLYSSRTCNGAADRRHPLIRDVPAGEESNEREVQRQLFFNLEAPDGYLFHFPALPRSTSEGKPLSLEQQLQFLQRSGQYETLVGDADVYVPSTPNSLHVPLHVRRVLGLDNVWFSQAGASLTRKMPDFWWPSLQDVMTLPNGMIRLWVELLHAGCITAE
jgi:hypothetical protein